MNRSVKTAAAAATTLALSVGGVATAGVAGASPTAPKASAAKVSAADVRFLRANDQTNLAEITLGTHVLAHARDASARRLARVTIRDHEAALLIVRAVAKREHVAALPARPNAMQRATARHLMRVHRINLIYFIAQVKGHLLSIASTKTEIAKGSNALVIRYAKAYLPVAQMHLRMARRDLARYRSQH